MRKLAEPEAAAQGRLAAITSRRLRYDGAMDSKILSRRDLEFLLYEWLDVEALCNRERFSDHSRETFESAIETARRIAVDLFLPHRRKSDTEEPCFDGERVTLIPDVKLAVDAFAEAGLLAASQDYELDGMQLPTVIDKACFTWFFGANVATAKHLSALVIPLCAMFRRPSEFSDLIAASA